MAARSTPRTAKRSPRRLLLLAGVVAALCLAGGAIAVYFGITNPTIPTGPPTAAAKSFLNDLQTQSYHDAYTFLCATAQSSVTEDDFVTQLKAGHAVTRYSIDGIDTKKVDNVPSATVTVTVTRDGGAVTHETVLLREPGDSWQVCGGSIMPNPASS
jgi:hypothetical protein